MSHHTKRDVGYEVGSFKTFEKKLFSALKRTEKRTFQLFFFFENSLQITMVTLNLEEDLIKMFPQRRASMKKIPHSITKTL